MHFQRLPYGQSKLVRVLSGRIQDVVVDLRRSETTFGKYFSLELSEENKKSLLVPTGFAHGFLVLSETADVIYKCDAFYNPQSEGGMRYDDPTTNIKWEFNTDEVSIIEKDLALPFISEVSDLF